MTNIFIYILYSFIPHKNVIVVVPYPQQNFSLWPYHCHKAAKDILNTFVSKPQRCHIRHGDAIPRLSLPLGIAIAYLSSCDFIESGNSAGGSSLRQQTPDYVITYL